jgi:hypothetical protein
MQQVHWRITAQCTMTKGAMLASRSSNSVERLHDSARGLELGGLASSVFLHIFGWPAAEL